MDNFIINKFLHKRFAYLLATFLSIFIFYIIFEHIFDLTNLVIKYNSSFDYGQYIKKSCDNEFFEYETERFQMNKDIDNLILQNTSNKQKYQSFVLIVSIIISLFISFVFSFIIYNSFYNSKWFHNQLRLSKPFEFDQNSDVSILKKAFVYAVQGIYLIISPFMTLFFLAKKMFYDEFNVKFWFSTPLLFLIILIIYVIIAGSVVIMPVYIGLNLGNNIDISPFNQDSIVYIPYIIVFVIMIGLRFINIIYQYSPSDEFHPISDYFDSHIPNIFTGNNPGGFLGFFAIFATYILSFYILGNIINMYKNPPDEKEEHESNVNIRKDILQYYMNKTLGFSEYNNFQVANVFVKHISGISFTLLISIVVMFIVMYLAIMYGANDNVKNLMKYGIIVPLAFIAVILITISITTEFNSIANEYLLKVPNTIYKQYIDILNNFFNKIISSEYQDTDPAPEYICRNVGNAILVMLYSELFQNVSDISRTGDDDGTHINITPEFLYDTSCEQNQSYDFADNDEYDIMYYLGGKYLKKNIFYNYNKCSQVNTMVLETISSNLQIFDSKELNVIMKKIQKKFYESNRVETKEPEHYIKMEIVGKNTDAVIKIDNFKSDLGRKIHNNIFNILNGNVCNDSSKHFISYNDDIKKYFQYKNEVDLNTNEVHVHNNEISRLPTKASDDRINTNYKTIVDDIVELYTENIYHFLYVFTPFYIKMNVNANTVKLRQDEKYKDLQNTLITELTKRLQITFDKINQKLTASLVSYEKHNMTKYIITNYNSIHMNNIYKRNILYNLDKTSSSQTGLSLTKANNIEIFSQIFQHLFDIYYKKIESINMGIKQNSVTITKLNDMIDQTVEQIYELDDEINIYKYDTVFQNEINSIFRNNSNKYNLTYDIYNVKTQKTKSPVISNKLYDVLQHSLDLCQILLTNIKEKQNILSRIDVSSKEDQEIDYYNNNIIVYLNILDTNINGMNNDLQNYKNEKLYFTNTISSLSDMNIDLSRNAMKDSCTVDQMIYMVCVNYIIAIILTYFIYNI